MFAHQLFGKEQRHPSGPFPIHFPSRQELDAAPASGVRVIWLGHSTMLVEIEGVRLLVDPVFAERASPSQHYGPKRFHPVPVALDQLPALDAVLISHDHYDHLDKHAIQQLAWRDVPFVTSLGVGDHLERWGIEPERIIELDWHE